MALLIRPGARTTEVIPWDLAGVPHVSLEHCGPSLLGTDDDMNVSIARSVSMREGVDSRNHILAGRTLYPGAGGPADTFSKVTPFTVFLQTKHRMRWVVWVKDDDMDDTLQRDGFTVSIGGGAPRGPYFLDAVLVPYPMKDRVGQDRYLPGLISPQQAEDLLDQPIGSLPRTLRRTVDIRWVRGIPRQLCAPAEVLRQEVVPVQTEDGTRGIMVTSSGRAPAKCDHCGQQFERLQRCSRCKAAFYCSKACSTAAWRAGHKQACLPASE